VAHATEAPPARVASVDAGGEARQAFMGAGKVEVLAALQQAGLVQHHLAVWAIPVPGAVAPGGVVGGWCCWGCGAAAPTEMRRGRGVLA